jgi:hypothetical protein
MYNKLTLYLGMRTPTQNLDMQGIKNWLYRDYYNAVLNYTLTFGDGVWKGTQEDSVILTVICKEADKDTEDTVRELARNFAETFNQECVVFTNSPIHVEFIQGGKNES